MLVNLIIRKKPYQPLTYNLRLLAVVAWLYEAHVVKYKVKSSNERRFPFIELPRSARSE